MTTHQWLIGGVDLDIEEIKNLIQESFEGGTSKIVDGDWHFSYALLDPVPSKVFEVSIKVLSYRRSYGPGLWTGALKTYDMHWSKFDISSSQGTPVPLIVTRPLGLPEPNLRQRNAVYRDKDSSGKEWYILHHPSERMARDCIRTIQLMTAPFKPVPSPQWPEAG
jgi:hypothetical protein